MHSALLIVQKPDFERIEQRQVEQAWQQLLANHLGFAAMDGCEVLGEACLLINLNDGPAALGKALQSAEQHGFPYRVLFFEKPPAWLVAPGQGPA